MAMISRRTWGARAPRGDYTTVRSTKGVKVHYTGGAVNPATLDDHDRCLRIMRDIQAFHMDGNGWMDFAYSLGACVHGDVLMGRGPGHLVAANGAGLNQDHYAVIGLVGSKGLIEPTDAMLHGILDAVDYLREQGGAGPEIKGHRDGYSTSCPGGPLYAWVKAGAPRPGAAPAGPPAWPGRLLRYPSGVRGTPMMVGEDIRTWQRGMHALGWVIDVDGKYGPQSREVALLFQKRCGLDRDGVVGPATWGATFAPQV